MLLLVAQTEECVWILNISHLPMISSRFLYILKYLNNQEAAQLYINVNIGTQTDLK